MTTIPTAAPAHPDLSPLLDQGDEGRERYTCILLAMIGGAEWMYNEFGWTLRLGVTANSRLAFVRWGAKGTKLIVRHLPNPLADTVEGRAAAWEMETRELCGWEHGQQHLVNGGEHRYQWWQIGGFRWGPWHPNRQRAAVDAVLHKYENDPRWAHLIAPLLNHGSEV